MEPPGDGLTKAIQNFPNPGMVVGMFAGKKVALIQTLPGSKCREKIDKTIKFFESANYIIAVGVCYVFERQKGNLGDVLVSETIRDLDRDEVSNVESFLSDVFCLNTTHDPEFKVTAGGRESEVHSGLVLSHPLLMDSKTERDKFHAAVPDAIGGEMEGGVLMQVSKEENNIIERGITVIKGVVEGDWGHFTAALAAIHYVQAKLKEVNLPAQGRHA
jgi:hypothetical protein